MSNRLRKIYLTITIMISIFFVYLTVFKFANSYLRLWESLVDLWSSVRIYFAFIFNRKTSAVPTVVEWSKVIKQEIILPEDLNEFTEQSKGYFALLFSKKNLLGYFHETGVKLSNFSRVVIILLPVFLLLYLLMKERYNTINNNYNRDTLPLRFCKRLKAIFYTPVRRFITGYVEYIMQNIKIFKIWLLMWVFNLNFISIIIAFIAYYLYFSSSFEFGGLFRQFCKLAIDLQVLFTTVPWWVFVIVGVYVFGIIRRRMAVNLLQHFEARNCGFINELPIVSMTCGSMGKKKTTIITDMALSQEVMFRQKAFELLQKSDMKFPRFPWIEFERDLSRCMEYRQVYNLATVKDWINKKRARFERNGNACERLYGYNIEKYGRTYDDGLKVWDLYEVLSDYARLYFIYVITSSLIVSNYSVRSDNELVSEGNFPLWNTTFFPPTTVETGRHAHILDFDILRLGRKVLEGNPNAGSFEFGVVLVTEVGKERGNNLELKEVKRTQEETNQKNDLFNSWLKMCRHSATVDNYPFVKVFTDEQRPASWGADARDLCDIIRIVGASEQRLALPFYTIEEMLTEWVFNKFINLYYDFRYKRGDNTLLIHVLKGITSWLYKRNARIYNKYGYSISKIEKERGTMDGKVEKKKYYVMNNKIYSRRFSTDCFSDYFNDLARKTKVGLNDYVEYATEKATIEELKLQHSYFIDGLYKTADSN